MACMCGDTQCPSCGAAQGTLETIMTREDLLNILTRYEGAIQKQEDENTEESILELEAARNALMDVLLVAKENLS